MEATLEHKLQPALRTRALLVAGSLAYAEGDYPAAAEHFQGALRLSRCEGDVLTEGHAWGGTALVEIVRQDYEAATFRLEKAIALFERCDEDYLMSALRVILATVLQARGEGELAERALEEGLASARRLGVPSLNYIALYTSAQTALARGDYRTAARMLAEGIEWSGRTKDRANLAYFLEALAVVTAFEGEGERSGLLLGATEALLEEVGASVYNYYMPDRSLYERAAASVRSQLGEEGFEQARAEGKTLGFEHAVEYALRTRP